MNRKQAQRNMQAVHESLPNLDQKLGALARQAFYAAGRTVEARRAAESPAAYGQSENTAPGGESGAAAAGSKDTPPPNPSPSAAVPSTDSTEKTIGQAQAVTEDVRRADKSRLNRARQSENAGGGE